MNVARVQTLVSYLKSLPPSTPFTAYGFFETNKVDQVKSLLAGTPPRALGVKCCAAALGCFCPELQAEGYGVHAWLPQAGGESVGCMVCHQWWLWGKPEKHAFGCLAALAR